MSWYTRLRAEVGRHAGSFTLVAIGGSSIVAAVVIRNDPFVAVALVGTGSALVALGASLPDVEEVSGGKKGFTLKRRVPTAQLAAGADPEEEEEEHPALAAPAEPFETDPEVTSARVALAGGSLRSLLNPSRGPLAGATLHLYLYDAGDNRLRALGVAGPPGEEGWEPGKGATGAAYELGEYVLATGEAVRDSTYGLTPDQQQRAADLAAVAAMPVFNAAGEVIAVLTASSTGPDISLDAPEAFDEMVAKANIIARVLIDVLEWYPDAYDGC